MKCQRARVLPHPGLEDTSMVGHELWVCCMPPEEQEAIREDDILPVTNWRRETVRCFDTPYVQDGTMIVVEPCLIELLARGPGDFADVDPLSWNAWRQGKI